MKTPLARLNLLHDKARTMVALSGVAFAVLLILMQWGFFGAVEETAVTLYRKLDFDLMVRSTDYKHFAQPGSFPRAGLLPAQSTPGVGRVTPLWVGFHLWRHPPQPHETQPLADWVGRRRGILVIGCRPFDQVFQDMDELQSQLPKLNQVGGVLIDQASRPEFGGQTPGIVGELGATGVELVGQFHLGTGFASDGQVVVGEETFVRVFSPKFRTHISAALIKLDDPSQAAAVLHELQSRLPPNMQAFTRAEVLAQERDFWVNRTSVGKIFGLGMVLAFFVGLAIVYQVLSSDVAARLPEYATLKAIGYGAGYLTRTVLQQSLWLAFLGFGPGLLASLGLYAVTREQARIPMYMTEIRCLTVFLLALVMCVLSGMAALRKVQAADPADLF